ncbi:MAG: hypothetical protein OJF49_001465 [Ktedonobacterales bacterium]|nr:MAG: hypothetical protein OJF49_001465 [Ktedonobacterales bacterium]
MVFQAPRYPDTHVVIQVVTQARRYAQPIESGVPTTTTTFKGWERMGASRILPLTFADRVPHALVCAG